MSTYAKHNSIASSKKRNIRLAPSVLLRARAIRGRFHAKAATPKTVALASLLFTAPEAPFTRKNTMFRANPNIQIASMMCENEAFVRCFLQIPKVEAMKTKLLCQASFRSLLYSALLSSTLFYCALLFSTLLYSQLLSSTLSSSPLLCVPRISSTVLCLVL